jgi:chromosomal replication initiator protein
LLGALMELTMASEANGKPIDAECIRRYIANHSREKQLTIRDIAVVTAKYFGLKLADLKSPSRRKEIVSARNLAVYIARQLANLSLAQIGDYFGGRDHTTILHSLRKTDKLVKTDPGTREALVELRRLIAMNH